MNLPQPPRYKAGAKLGNLTVAEVLVRSRINPETGRDGVRALWWYECRCKCGSKVVVSQSYLNDDRKRRQCAECAKDSKSRVLSVQKQQRVAAPPIPDFATMRLNGEGE